MIFSCDCCETRLLNCCDDYTHDEDDNRLCGECSEEDANIELLTCDCCDEDFDPNDEYEWRHIDNDETTQCTECIEKAEREHS